MFVPFEYKLIEPVQCANAAVIWLHGLGATADDFVKLVPHIKVNDSLAIRYYFPQAPDMSITIDPQTVKPSWYDVYGFNLHSPQDESGIRASEQRLAHLIEEIIDSGIPSHKIVLAGYSQGGAMALHTFLRFSQTLAGALVLSSYLPIAEFLMEEKHKANQHQPIFLAHGNNDQVLPIVAAEMTTDYLTNAGYQVEKHIYQMAHEVCLEEIDDIGQWLTRVLS